ncbi:hypothetical protein YH62_17895 [Rhizobium sp. LC145]|nr:hypothetical protein YH62_17895 [Rhizobium sp. LC145]
MRQDGQTFPNNRPIRWGVGLAFRSWIESSRLGFPFASVKQGNNDETVIIHAARQCDLDRSIPIARLMKQ